MRRLNDDLNWDIYKGKKDAEGYNSKQILNKFNHITYRYTFTVDKETKLRASSTQRNYNILDVVSEFDNDYQTINKYMPIKKLQIGTGKDFYSITDNFWLKICKIYLKLRIMFS